MPATAGRVRMPANNRVHSSAALQTHGIWQSAIGYDPYAPTKDSDKGSALPGENGAAASSENAYASFQGLLALARVTGSGSNEARGACRKCGRVGHLTFQCRNFLSAKDPEKDKDDDDALQEAAATAACEEEEESDSSDSDVDPEIEKIIAARLGKKSKKSTDHQKRKRSSEDDVEEDKHGHRHKRSRRSRRDEKRRKSHRKRDVHRRHRHQHKRGHHAPGNMGMIRSSFFFLVGTVAGCTLPRITMSQT